jgi:hypothetical protein
MIGPIKRNRTLITVLIGTAAIVVGCPKEIPTLIIAVLAAAIAALVSDTR